MKGVKIGVFLVASALVVLGVLFLGRSVPREIAVEDAGSDLTEPAPTVVRGVQMQQLPTAEVKEDFLWGAAKFAVFYVTAPTNQDFVVDKIKMVMRGTATAETIPTAWLRIDRKRVYAETPFEANALTITAFPDKNLLPNAASTDIEVGGEINRLMDTPLTSVTIPAGEEIVFEVFGNFDQDLIIEPVEAFLCLESVEGFLIEGDIIEPATSSLNETCWNPTTVVPVEIDR